MSTPAEGDPRRAGLVLGLPEDGLLATFNRAGVLTPADVHVARRLSHLGGDRDEAVALATALAVRAPRLGHVRVELTTVGGTATTDDEEEVDLAALPWPDPQTWVARLGASPLVATGKDPAPERPLRLLGTALYLDRHFQDERRVADDLLARAGTGHRGVDEALLDTGLARLFPDDPSGEQRLAAAAAVRGRLAVIAGGPGTGKTTTVARLLALVVEQAGTLPRPPAVALAAPTGKAAARLAEAVRAETGRLAVDEAVRRRLSGVDASTLHRLLGPHPGGTGRFRHDRTNRLPHDLVIVDETSMVPLWLMARLTEAVRPDARLVLVGDPGQLASVEAGAVLGDVVGPALALREPATTPRAAAPGPSPPAAGLADAIVVLRTNRRFQGALVALADAVRAGDGDGAVEVLSSGAPEVLWLPVDPVREEPSALAPVRSTATELGTCLVRAGGAGDARTALDALGGFRVLCAHRRGPAGVAAWNARVADWVAGAVDGLSFEGGWYVGQPVMVTANDYGLGLYNGDTGVVVARDEGGVAVVFGDGEAQRAVSPSRLADLETVFAMTVHKAQGSEFEEVAILVPDPGSRVLSRELLYTAVTRARARVMVVATEASVRAAVGRPVARASGLTDRLWGPRSPTPTA